MKFSGEVGRGRRRIAHKENDRLGNTHNETDKSINALTEMRAWTHGDISDFPAGFQGRR